MKSKERKRHFRRHDKHFRSKYLKEKKREMKSRTVTL